MERHLGIRREGFGVRGCSTAIGRRKRVKWDWMRIECISRMENDKRRVKLYQPVILFLAFTSVRGVLVLQPHEVDGSEGTKERGSEGNVSYLERMGLACK